MVCGVLCSGSGSVAVALHNCSRSNGLVVHLVSALKSSPVSVLLPFLEGPRTRPVPESFRMQGLWTRTVKKKKKKHKKPVETGCNWSRNEYNKTCAISAKIGHTL